MKSFLRLVLLWALLTGCQTHPTEQPRVQALRWDALLAKGAIHDSPPGSGKVLYSRLNIDLEKIGIPLQIQMPDGQVLDTTAPMESFWPYTMFGHRVKFPEKFRRGHRFFDVVFPGGCKGMIGGYSLEYENGRMVGLGIGALKPKTPDVRCPALRVPPKSGLQVLPFTEEQLVDLFGPYRDRIEVRSFESPVLPP